MADGVAITAGSGTTILTDDCGASGHAQVFKLGYGANADATVVGADANGLDVDITRFPSIARRVTVTPTVSTSPAYTAGDAVGGLMTFTSAHGTSGGKFIIDTVTILDLAKQSAALDLVLFDQSFTASTDNAVFDPSDADAANVIGFVPIAAGNYADFNDWSVATVRNVGLAGALSGSTSLYGQLVARGTPTYAATTDIKVILSLREV